MDIIIYPLTILKLSNLHLDYYHFQINVYTFTIIISHLSDYHRHSWNFSNGFIIIFSLIYFFSTRNIDNITSIIIYYDHTNINSNKTSK